MRPERGKGQVYVYDAADRRLYLTDPDGGRTSYAHDAAGQLILVNAPGAGSTSLRYDNASRLSAACPPTPHASATATTPPVSSAS